MLHEVCDSEYADIARILGKNEPACRQIVRRAKERVRQQKPRFKVSVVSRMRLLERFLEALRMQDHASLLSLFAADATWTSDGGGKAKAARKVMHGAVLVSRFAIGVWRRYLRRMSQRVMAINGEAGIAMFDGERPVAVLTIDTDGARILSVYVVLNPDKLRHIAPAGVEV